jgi:hypothetical protein
MRYQAKIRLRAKYLEGFAHYGPDLETMQYPTREEPTSWDLSATHSVYPEIIIH